MLQAKKFLRQIGVGVTAPCLLRANDGNLYVVKFKNNRLGTKVLVNEYLAARLGEIANLCFPPGSPLEITAAFIRHNLPLRRRNTKPGLHFASRYISPAKYVQSRHLIKICNKSEIAGVMLFDHIMHNEDRTLNGKNMLIQPMKNGYRFYAIDNSHLFGSGRWRNERLEILKDRVVLNERRAYGTLLRHYLTAEDFAPYIQKFQSISTEQLQQVVDEIPQEWLTDEQARSLLKEFLIRRCACAALIAARIIEKIPH